MYLILLIMINNIKESILDNINTTPLILIYERLKTLFNDHDIRFTLLTYFNYDINLELKQETEEREKRRYQKLLRKQCLERYQHKCVISGIDKNILLEVAHIKPVSECKSMQEKADINNVLLLWIDIHKYFDAYELSINPETCKVEVKCDYLLKYNGLEIELNTKTREYLKHHYSFFTKPE